MTTADDRPLDVVADLTVEVGDATVSVQGYGDLVVVSAPTFAAARTLAATPDTVVDRLTAADVTVDLRVRGRSVARAGPGHTSGPLSRALGVDPARVSPGGLLLAALSRR
ncbi:peptide ABC transporter ATP-binding protein [Haloplanus salilacus]|uniref:peptide ABC transporter ATP-binding protein n=1 Tax=Haloplanus salilacus TaxID=2949994 RepID=UPI0030D2B3E0